MFFAVIPAREGSKRFPKKNTELVPFAIEAAFDAGINDVFVFTDDPGIARDVRRTDARVVQRARSDDRQSMRAALVQFVGQMDLDHDDVLIVLYPTFPLRDYEDIESLLATVNDIDSSAPWDSVLGWRRLHTPVHLVYRSASLSPAYSNENATYRQQDEEGEFFELTHFHCAVRVGALVSPAGACVNPQLRSIRKGHTFFLEASPFRSSFDVDYEEDWHTVQAVLEADHPGLMEPPPLRIRGLE